MSRVMSFTSNQAKQDLEEYKAKINASFEKWFKGIRFSEGNDNKDYYKSMLHAAYFEGYHNGFKQSVDKWLEEHSI